MNAYLKGCVHPSPSANEKHIVIFLDFSFFCICMQFTEIDMNRPLIFCRYEFHKFLIKTILCKLIKTIVIFALSIFLEASTGENEYIFVSK